MLKNGEYEDDVTRNLIIEELSAIEQYFCEVEDYEWCRDIIGRFCLKHNNRGAKKNRRII